MPYDVAFQAKIFPMLMQAFDDGIGSVVNGRLYATVAPPQPTYPLIVYQSQDGGGLRTDTIGRNGWEGMITFRSIDTTYSGAWNNILGIVNAIPNVVASGYRIEYLPEKPQWFPVERISTTNIYTAAIIVRFKIEKE